MHDRSGDAIHEEKWRCGDLVTDERTDLGTISIDATEIRTNSSDPESGAAASPVVSKRRKPRCPRCAGRTNTGGNGWLYCTRCGYTNKPKEAEKDDESAKTPGVLVHEEGIIVSSNEGIGEITLKAETEGFKEYND